MKDWILYKELQPNNGEKCLFTIEYLGGKREVVIGVYTPDFAHIVSQHDNPKFNDRYYKVIAWQPCPIAYYE